MLLAIINNSVKTSAIIIDLIREWVRNNLIINHLTTTAGFDAAFYWVMVSFKIAFKCNIYDYKPFLTHTESITH